MGSRRSVLYNHFLLAVFLEYSVRLDLELSYRYMWQGFVINVVPADEIV